MKRFKKIMLYLLLLIVLLFVAGIIMNYPASSPPKELARLADTTNIRHNLERIINMPVARNYQNTEVLDSVAEFIRGTFSRYSDRVSRQQFKVDGKWYANVIASFGPEFGERIIVGAHYDVCGDQDGADDNASGVAGLLELARLLKDEELKYPVDLVAYTLEEPPFFGTENMGSYVHAKSLYDKKVPVKGMVSLEMIGYYSDQENSQHYPLGFLKWFYGNKGDFITVVQKPFNGSFSNQFKSQYFAQNSILAKSFKAPPFFGGIGLSDHRNYWKFGYSSVMVTNTAFNRNLNYHSSGDVLERLDIPRMGLVIDGVYRVLMAMK